MFARDPKVQEALKPDILGLKKPGWNESTVVPGPLCVRPTRALGVAEPVKTYDYRSLDVTKAFSGTAKKLNATLGSSGGGESEGQWKVETAVEKNLRERLLEETTLKATVKSRKVGDTLIEGKYVPPETRSELVTTKRRERLALEREIGKVE